MLVNRNHNPLTLIAREFGDLASSVLFDLEFLQALVILLHVYRLLLLKPCLIITCNLVNFHGWIQRGHWILEDHRNLFPLNGLHFTFAFFLRDSLFK